MIGAEQGDRRSDYAPVTERESDDVETKRSEQPPDLRSGLGAWLPESLCVNENRARRTSEGDPRDGCRGALRRGHAARPSGGR
jgi:hypothetical protein